MCYNGSGQEQQKCTTEVCLGRYVFQESKYEANCNSGKTNISTLVIQSEILTQNISANIKSSDVSQIIEYACEFNECNSRATFNRINNVTNQHYNLFELYKSLGVNYQSEQELHTTSTSINNQSEQELHTTSTSISTQSTHTTDMIKDSGCSIQFKAYMINSFLSVFTLICLYNFLG
jgi:hypothetical protein